MVKLQQKIRAPGAHSTAPQLLRYPQLHLDHEERRPACARRIGLVRRRRLASGRISSDLTHNSSGDVATIGKTAFMAKHKRPRTTPPSAPKGQIPQNPSSTRWRTPHPPRRDRRRATLRRPPHPALHGHLEEIATLVNERLAVIDAIEELIAASHLKAGTASDSATTSGPNTLTSPATIIAKDGEKWLVRLDEPVGRFTNVDLRFTQRSWNRKHYLNRYPHDCRSWWAAARVDDRGIRLGESRSTASTSGPPRPPTLTRVRFRKISSTGPSSWPTAGRSTRPLGLADRGLGGTDPVGHGDLPVATPAALVAMNLQSAPRRRAERAHKGPKTMETCTHCSPSRSRWPGSLLTCRVLPMGSAGGARNALNSNS